MKKIAVITATRAEYSLLKPVIRELRKHESDLFRVDLIVTGTHLYEQYGMTIDEIDQRVDRRVEISVGSESDEDISVNQADALLKFTKVFVEEQYDGLLILGDRYEMLAVAIAAGNTRTPIFHMCGGDTTEGALDEWIRHSITKISYLHFVTNRDSYNRVVQLGENPSRVFNYGSTSIDNILELADMSKDDALESIGLSDCNYALCTFHPVTMENESIETKLDALLDAIKVFPELQFIVTKSNADKGGVKINSLLDEACTRIDNIHVFSSLGARRYLSLMRYADFVIGNSSSGIIETPAFGIPTINIGDRQKGRLRTASIIDCGETTADIVAAVNKAISSDFIEKSRQVVSPYGDGNAAGRIADKIFEVIKAGSIDLKKKFYDKK